MRPYGTNIFISQLILSSSDGVSKDGADAIQELGCSLKRIGLLPDADFKEYIRTVFYQGVHELVYKAQMLLESRKDAPYYWVNDVQRFLSTAEQGLVNGSLFIPADLKGSPEERQQQLRALIVKLGELLRHWPDILTASQDLRLNDQRLAAKIGASSKPLN